MSTDWTPNFGTLDRTAPTWAPKRPVRIAILGDFSARACAGRLDTGSDLARRKPIAVEFDSLEDALARLDVQLQLPLGEQGSVELRFPDLDAFHPDQLYRDLEVFSHLGGLRKQLNNTATFAKAAAQVQAWAGGNAPKVSRTSRRSKARGASPAIDGKLSDFARLTGLPSVADTAATSIDNLVRGIVGPFIVAAPNPQKDALVAAVDQGLSDAMRAVLHHADFQNLESLWRGLDLVLRRLETGPMLQVHLIDVSAEELAADLSAHDDLADTALYQWMVEQPSQDKNGGYALACGLFHFEATPPHVELLGRIARIAQQAAAPFVTGMGIDGLTDRRKPPHPLVAEALHALQSLPAASHLSLMAPRFMLRHPYGKRTDPISVFDFEEFTPEAGLRGMLWGHPALLAAVAFAGPGGMGIDDLPFYHFKDAHGDTIALPCTERMVHTDAATSLREWGITPVLAHKGAPEVRLAGLDAVTGRPLGQAGVAPSRPRVSIDTRVTTGTGKGTGMTVSAQFKKPAAPAPSAEDRYASSADDAPASTASGDDDLDALLASLDAGGSSDSPAPADSGGGSGDDDLDALLASLGGDDAPSSEAPASNDDEGMDPELAALLASLE